MPNRRLSAKLNNFIARAPMTQLSYADPTLSSQPKVAREKVLAAEGLERKSQLTPAGVRPLQSSAFRPPGVMIDLLDLVDAVACSARKCLGIRDGERPSQDFVHVLYGMDRQYSS